MRDCIMLSSPLKTKVLASKRPNIKSGLLYRAGLALPNFCSLIIRPLHWACHRGCNSASASTSTCWHSHLGGFMKVFKLPYVHVNERRCCQATCKAIWLLLHSASWRCFQSWREKWYLWREIYPVDFETK